MRVIFMYHDEEPHGSQYTPGSLPDPAEAFKQARSLFLTQRVNQSPIKLDARMKIMELRNQDVELPQFTDTLHWCKMFKLSDINRKHHLIRVSSFRLGKGSVSVFDFLHIFNTDGEGGGKEGSIICAITNFRAWSCVKAFAFTLSLVLSFCLARSDVIFPVRF